MKASITPTILVLAWIAGASPCLGCQDHDVRASPFDGLRWDDGAAQVLVEEGWYIPVSIDDLQVEAILEFCGSQWPGQTQKRFGEDLVEAMVRMGWEGDLFVDLELERLEGGGRVMMKEVAMTEAKRNAIRDSARSGVRPPEVPVPAVVPRSRAEAVLREFQERLNEQFSYLELRGIDLDAEISILCDDLKSDVSVLQLTQDMNALLMRFGDGHAVVRSRAAPSEAGGRYLPILLQRTSIGVVAIRPDRSALVNPEAPVVEAIDGLDLEEWVAMIRPHVPAGSPQLVERRAFRLLREFYWALDLFGYATGEPIRVRFRAPKKRRGQTVELKLSSRRPTYGLWPKEPSGILEGEIGYLRIPEMNDDVDVLRESMEEFTDTKGLIVDVRGNGGGSRDLLIALAGYLIPKDGPAWVGNVAAYRLAPDFGLDHLEARFMYRADWSGWTDAEREAVEAFAPTFEPEWALPEGFSEWHYLVLGRTGDAAEYHYDMPVVILSDAGCFSATDIFLGALELLPDMTLVGTASSGGSARSQRFRLDLRIEVRCASMASFRPDGRLYDGRGIEVDVEVWPEAGDLLRGGGDAQLEAALKVIEASGR